VKGMPRQKLEEQLHDWLPSKNIDIFVIKGMMELFDSIGKYVQWFCQDILNSLSQEELRLEELNNYIRNIIYGESPFANRVSIELSGEQVKVLNVILRLYWKSSSKLDFFTSAADISQLLDDPEMDIISTCRSLEAEGLLKQVGGPGDLQYTFRVSLPHLLVEIPERND